MKLADDALVAYIIIIYIDKRLYNRNSYCNIPHKKILYTKKE